MLVAPVLSAFALAVASVELVVTSPMVFDVRPAASAVVPATGPAVPAALDRAEIGTGPLQVPRPAAPLRRAASRSTRAQAPSPAVGDASALPGLLAHTGVALPSDAQPRTPRPEAVAPAVRPAVEGTPEADLPGSRMAAVAVADGLPATVEESGKSGMPAGSPLTPWGAAADAGVTVGKGTQRAAVATAGFFTKLSKSISGVF